jgi:ABC-type enterochelin transport system substrate-binding protein
VESKINNFKKTGKQFFLIGIDSKSREHGISISFGYAQNENNDYVFAAICHNTIKGKSRYKRVYVSDTKEDLREQLKAQIEKRRLEWKNMKFI